MFEGTLQIKIQYQVLCYSIYIVYIFVGPYLESFLVIVESISAIACHAAVTYYYCYNNMYYNSNENYRKLFENTGTKQKK